VRGGERKKEREREKKREGKRERERERNRAQRRKVTKIQKSSPSVCRRVNGPRIERNAD